MSIYSATVAVPAAFPAANAPSVTIPFEPKKITLVNCDTTAANYVEFSFDGVNVHGRITPTVNPKYKSGQRQTLVWLRRGAGTPTCVITAES